MDRREGNMDSPRPEYMAEITNQRLAIRDASNPKPSAESVIVLTEVTSELPSVAAPAIVHLGFARADHPHSATASVALGHREFPRFPIAP
jgi:hypothetical protein